MPPGLVLGALGILAFSFSFPATKLAVEDLPPELVACGRAAVAAGLAAIVLRVSRAPRPSGPQWRRLAAVALGVVLGFPLLTSIALEGRDVAHVAVITAVMPAATAVAAVLRAGERPSTGFWLASGAGMVAVVAFAVAQGAGDLRRDDVLALLAVVLVGWGYAEGGTVAREIGGARTICWALLLSLPLTLPATILSAAGTDLGAAGAPAWLGFAYVTAFSMFLGFFAWYAGLARGGVAKVGQIQLAQPVLTLAWSALLLGESVDALTLGTAVVVLASVAATQRTRVRQTGDGAGPQSATAVTGAGSRASDDAPTEPTSQTERPAAIAPASCAAGRQR